jgi:Spy/CpxP family protein refolding chaperone
VKRSILVILVVSLALNAGFLGAAAYRIATRSGPLQGPERFQRNQDPRIDLPEDQHHPVRHGRDAVWTPRRLHRLGRHMRLEQAQREELEASLIDLEAEVVALATRLREERHRLRSALMRGHTDAERIRAQIREISRLQSRLDSLAAEGMIRELQILRPEQRLKYVNAFRGRGLGHERHGPTGP